MPDLQEIGAARGDGAAAGRDATRLLLRVAPEQIVELHALLEGYDDLALLRTLRPAEGLVEVWISPGAEAAFSSLRESLAAEGLPTTCAEGSGRDDG